MSFCEKKIMLSRLGKLEKLFNESMKKEKKRKKEREAEE